MDTIEAMVAERPRAMDPEEWKVRVDLAACYRLIAHFGWDDLVLTHNSARVPGTTDQMLINPSGLMFDEITASNLLKVDMDERERLQHDIGQHSVLVLRNHGLLATGRNVAEAFSSTYHFERSAEAQLKIMAAVAAGAKMVVPSPETCERQAAQFVNAVNNPRLGGQREGVARDHRDLAPGEPVLEHRPGPGFRQ